MKLDPLRRIMKNFILLEGLSVYDRKNVQKPMIFACGRSKRYVEYSSTPFSGIGKSALLFDFQVYFENVIQLNGRCTFDRSIFHASGETESAYRKAKRSLAQFKL